MFEYGTVWILHLRSRIPPLWLQIYKRGIKRRPGKQPAREGERRLRVMYSRARSSLLEAIKQKINQYSLYFSFYILSVIDFNSTNVS